MKKTPNLLTRLAVAAATAGALTMAAPLLAQDESKTGQGATGSSSSTESATSSNANESGSSSSKQSSGGANSGGNSKASSSSKASGGATSGGALSAQDRQFMMNAAKDGMREVDMGKMAQQNGQSADVKKLGGMMVTDHTKANSQLMALAQKKGLTLDTKHPVDKPDKGTKFDDTWLNHMVMDHQRAVDQFQTEARDGTDPDVKSFANKTLPTLKKHLQAVQTAQTKVGAGGPSGQSTGPKKKG